MPDVVQANVQIHEVKIQIEQCKSIPLQVKYLHWKSHSCTSTKLLSDKLKQQK